VLLGQRPRGPELVQRHLPDQDGVDVLLLRL
jgi:hypothetical protein